MATCITLAVSIVLADSALAESTSQLDVMENLMFSEDTTAFTNPDRGWYKMYMSSSSFSGLGRLKSSGIGVILLCVDLKDFKASPISDSKLSEIRNAFSKIRQAGYTAIFRAAYDFDGVKAPEPKSLDIITGHIAQLSSIFHANEDVLYCIQAGFLGSWGEWHSSYYGGTPSLEARKAVLSALMNAVPGSRTILVRRPMFIRDMFDNQTISASSAFSGSNLARTGYHNDALLSTADENGTYVQAGYNRQAELAWSNNLTTYTPFVGESDMLTSYSDTNNAVYELNTLHAQSISGSYYGAVISKWKSTSYGGMSTYDYIASRLGYRLMLSDVKVSATVNNGGALHVNFNAANTGFGNILSSRNYEIVLSNGSQTYAASVSDDLRSWTKENGVINKDLYLSIPSGITPGTWNVYINFPSPYSSLKNNAAYSIRLANAGVWEKSTGYNLIKQGLNVESVDNPNAISAFRLISRDEALALVKSASGNVQAASAVPPPVLTPVPTPDLTVAETPMVTPVPQPVETPAAFDSGFDNTSSASPTAAPQIIPLSDNTAGSAADTPQSPNVEVKGVYSMSVKNDDGNIYLSISGSSLNTKSQFFINADNNSNTGYRYKWAEAGFEYLIEDDILYRYIGANNKWKWERVQGVSVKKDDNGIYVLLPIKIINADIGSTIGIGFISNDDISLVYPLLDANQFKYTIIKK